MTRVARPELRPLRYVLAANVVSVTGTSLTLLAVPWFVLQTTQSAAHAGLVAFSASLPLALSAFFGGPLIDRVGRRRTSIGTDLVCGVTIACVPLLHFADALPFGLLCALMAFNGLFHAPGETSRNVLMPSLATHTGIPLPRVASYYDGVARGARMTGTALAGVLIATLGAELVLLVNSGTFVLSAALVAVGLRRFTPADPMPATTKLSPRSYREDLATGFRYLVRMPLILGVALLVMVTNSLDMGWSSVLLPVHARENLGGSVQLGLLTALVGGGALIGALLYGAFGARLPRWPVFVVCFLLAGSPRMFLAAFSDGLAPLAVVLFIDGLAAGALNPILATVLYERVPDQLRSRVMGISTAGALAATPVGGLAAGVAVELLGLSWTLLLVGGVYLAATVAPLVIGTFRAMDAPPTTIGAADRGPWPSAPAVSARADAAADPR